MTKNRCDYCGGRFGLVLYRDGLRRFCSDKKGKRCRFKFRAERDQRIYEEKQRWLRFLCS